jgi:hypothetical protein
MLEMIEGVPPPVMSEKDISEIEGVSIWSAADSDAHVSVLGVGAACDIEDTEV